MKATGQLASVHSEKILVAAGDDVMTPRVKSASPSRMHPNHRIRGNRTKALSRLLSTEY
jgi:hypothetical protein